MMPYRLIPLISALKEFYFLVTVGPSAPFGPKSPQNWEFQVVPEWFDF